MTDSQTTIDSLRSVRPIIDKMNQHLLDNVKKCVDQEGVVVKFIRTGHNLADPLTKRIKDHANRDNVMSSKPVTSFFFSQNSFFWIFFYLHFIRFYSIFTPLSPGRGVGG